VIVLQAYTDDGNHKQQPIMIHRAIFGSIERFFGILIENCAGAFPLWLAPVQCRIMPVTDAVLDYAQDVVAQMREAGIRVQLDSGKAIDLFVSYCSCNRLQSTLTLLPHAEVALLRCPSTAQLA